MDIFNYKDQAQAVRLQAGCILIAEPMLADPNFSKSVVLICEYSADGVVGLVLNKPTEYTLGELLSGFDNSRLSVCEGGPVQKDALLLVHKMPDRLGGALISGDLYWGGSFDQLEVLINAEAVHNEALRVFMGYSGWSAGQLQHEIEQNSWLVIPFNEQLVFNTLVQDIWNTAVAMLGPKYAYLANIPQDSRLN